MTNYDAIKELTLEEMAELLEYGATEFLEVPSCDEECEKFGSGCALHCQEEKRLKTKISWLKRDY